MPATAARPNAELHTAIAPDYVALAARIKSLARASGFQRCGISDVVLGEDETHLRDWLAQGLHGSMEWMARHGVKRARPQELLSDSVRQASSGSRP